VTRPPRNPRKTPTQRRAIETYGTILTAAAHILVERGVSGFTTNHVARRAGVPIGSVYQYFPNKDAILSALLRRQLERARATRPGVLDAGPELPLRERLAATIAWHFATVREDPALAARLHEAFLDILTPQEQAEFDVFHQAAVRRGLEACRSEITLDLDVASAIVSQFLVFAPRAIAALQRARELPLDAYQERLADSLHHFLTRADRRGGPEA
jgi:AcrR family transcriptional regulator